MSYFFNLLFRLLLTVQYTEISFFVLLPQFETFDCYAWHAAVVVKGSRVLIPSLYIV